MLDRCPVRLLGGGAEAQNVSDAIGCDGLSAVVRSKDCVQWTVRWSIALSQVKDTSLEGTHWTNVLVPGAAVSHFLACNGALLIGESQIDISGSLDVVEGSCSCIERAFSQLKLHVLESEGSTERVGRCAGIFAWTAKEIESN